MKRPLIIAGFCAMAISAHAQSTTFKSQMSGAQEVPPKSSGGTGSATVTLDGNKVDYTVQYSGLSGPATAAHIHCGAAPGANAGVAVAFNNPASPIKGSGTMTDQQKADLIAGKCYTNVHTAADPGGEIRGQLERSQ